jgi:hypothetical protein
VIWRRCRGGKEKVSEGDGNGMVYIMW